MFLVNFIFKKIIFWGKFGKFLFDKVELNIINCDENMFIRCVKLNLVLN